MSGGHTIVVHRWDVRAPLPDAMIDEIFRAHKLRNKLVEFHKTYEAEVAEVWASHPEVALAQARVVETSAVVTATTEAIKAWRIKAGVKSAPKELSERLRFERSAQKAAKADLRELKATVMVEVTEQLRSCRERERASRKAHYRVATGEGLYWASWNAVCDGFDTSVKLVGQKRAAGRPAEVRFQRWEGEGTISIQVASDSKCPHLRTPDNLREDSEVRRWQEVFALHNYPSHDWWECASRSDIRRLARGGEVEVTWRFGQHDKAQVVRLPVAVGRELPPDAEIVAAQLTRRMVAGKEHATIAVTMRVPHPAPATGGRSIVHLGWRALGGDHTRVAVVEGVAPPPQELVALGVVKWHGHWGEVVAPPGWIDWDRRIDSIASIRSKGFDVHRDMLSAWIGAQASPPLVEFRGELEPLTAASVARWGSPQRLAKLVASRPSWLPPDLFDVLEAWRKQDAHLWQWHASSAKRLAARRTDAWRKVARWVASSAAIVATDDWSIAELKEVPDITVTDDAQMQQARRQARIASPGILREQIERAAKARGAVVERPETQLQTHHCCGGVFDPAQRRKQIMVDCPTCGAVVDQDLNAAAILDDLASGEEA